MYRRNMLSIISQQPIGYEPLVTTTTNLTGACCDHCDVNKYGQLDLEIDNQDLTSKRLDRSFQINTITDCQDILLIQSFKHLIRMYSTQVQESTFQGFPGGAAEGLDQPLILCGGLQQYLIKNMKKKTETCEQPRRGAGSDTTTFHDLPDSLHLTIFSYLDVIDLCRISNVCRHWYCVASDNILWQERLERDIRCWEIISHTTYPQTYRECQSDWTNKEIYLRCSPDVTKLMKQSNIGFHHLSSILRTIWPKKTPRVAMFGPGLESGTSSIARKILEDQTGMFKTTGMFPGQFEGIGSGFTMKMGGTSLHLMTLYTSTRRERESHAQNERLQHSRLLAQKPQNQEEGDSNSDDEEVYEVRKAVKDLCATIDAFIFVLDASQDEQSISSARAELRAMISERWVAPSVPVVVLACVPEASSKRSPCVDIVRQMKLSKLSRPWQVRDCIVDQMTGVIDSIAWVVEQAQRTS